MTSTLRSLITSVTRSLTVPARRITWTALNAASAQARLTGVIVAGGSGACLDGLGQQAGAGRRWCTVAFAVALPFPTGTVRLAVSRLHVELQYPERPASRRP